MTELTQRVECTKFVSKTIHRSHDKYTEIMTSLSLSLLNDGNEGHPGESQQDLKQH